MKDKGLRGFIGTLKCFVGLHYFGDPRRIYTPICTRCGKRDRRWRPYTFQHGNIVHGDQAGGDINKPLQPNAGLEPLARKDG